MTGRQMADLSEARTVLDVLRGPGDDGFDPKRILHEVPKDKTKQGDKKDPNKPEPRKFIPPKNAAELLTRGLDPQLNTAVLLVKTRLLKAKAP